MVCRPFDSYRAAPEIQPNPQAAQPRSREIFPIRDDAYNLQALKDQERTQKLSGEEISPTARRHQFWISLLQPFAPFPSPLQKPRMQPKPSPSSLRLLPPLTNVPSLPDLVRAQAH